MKKHTFRRFAVLLCTMLVLVPQPSFAVTGTSDADMRAKTASYEAAPVPYTYDTSARPVSDTGCTARFVKKNGIYTNPEAEETNRATLMITGDLMCQWRQQKAAYLTSSQPENETISQNHQFPDPSWSGQPYDNFNPKEDNPSEIGVLPQPTGFFDFRGSFRYVRNLLLQGDLVIGNLETMISESSPLTMQLHQTEERPYLNSPHEFLEALDYAGFDLLTLANNHSCDTGVRGILETLNALDTYQFLHTGLFADAADTRYLVVDVNGIKVGIVSYTSYYNTKDSNFTQEGRLVLLNRFTEKKAARDISAARNAGAEFVIAFMHWGTENVHEPTELQQTNALKVANAGADYIVGSHPHAIQPTDKIHTADGRTVPVIYSMGNFLSSMQEDINNDALVLQLDLEKNVDGKVTIADHLLHPCTILSDLELQNGPATVHTDSYVVTPHNELYGVDKVRLRLLASCREDFIYMESSLGRFNQVFGTSTDLQLDPAVTGIGYTKPDR